MLADCVEQLSVSVTLVCYQIVKPHGATSMRSLECRSQSMTPRYITADDVTIFTEAFGAPHDPAVLLIIVGSGNSEQVFPEILIKSAC